MMRNRQKNTYKHNFSYLRHDVFGICFSTNIKSLRDSVFGMVKVDVESPIAAIEEAKRVVESMILS